MWGSASRGTLGRRLIHEATVALPVGPRILASVVERMDMVVLPIQRLDHSLNEPIKFGKELDNVRRRVEVHGDTIPPGARRRRAEAP